MDLTLLNGWTHVGQLKIYKMLKFICKYLWLISQSQLAEDPGKGWQVMEVWEEADAVLVCGCRWCLRKFLPWVVLAKLGWRLDTANCIWIWAPEQVLHVLWGYRNGWRERRCPAASLTALRDADGGCGLPWVLFHLERGSFELNIQHESLSVRSWTWLEQSQGRFQRGETLLKGTECHLKWGENGESPRRISLWRFQSLTTALSWVVSGWQNFVLINTGTAWRAVGHWSLPECKEGSMWGFWAHDPCAAPWWGFPARNCCLMGYRDCKLELMGLIASSCFWCGINLHWTLLYGLPSSKWLK